MIEEQGAGGADETRMALALSAHGVDLALMLEAPSTAELFRHYADLVVVSDYIGFSAFSRLVDSSSPSTVGFLTPQVLDMVRSRFGHRAKSPGDLLRMPINERVRPQNVDRHCSLLHLGTLDREYAGKFLFFVPSLVHDSKQVPDAYAVDYVEAGLYVAAYRRSRAVYFAGFGGTDGSFPDDVVVRLAERIFATRQAVPLPPLRVFLKYFPLADEARISGLVERLAELAERKELELPQRDSEAHAA